MDTWDLMQNWSYVLPPSRPSARQLKEILTISKTIDHNAPVAILGSTPEFRLTKMLISMRQCRIFEFTITRN